MEVTMTEQSPPDQPDAPKDGVPPELIAQLHEANEQFSRAREHLEEAIETTDMNCLEERKRAAHEVQVAEQALEKMDEKIEKELL
jgi:hypothetical protein